MLGSSRVPAKLAASQEGLSSMKLVYCIYHLLVGSSTVGRGSERVNTSLISTLPHL
jgi:hypothetical protein